MSRNKGNIPLLLLVLVAIVFMAIGILIYQQQLSNARPPLNSEQLSSQTLETYINDELGFKIDYPKAMKITKDQWNEYMGDRSYTVYLIGNEGNTTAKPLYDLTINVFPKIDEAIWTSLKKDGQLAILAGYDAVRIEATQPAMGGEGTYRFVSYTLIRNGSLYSLSARTSNDQIISIRSLEEVIGSFDFLAGPESVPQGWNKIIVQPGLFSIAAPADWNVKRTANTIEFKKDSNRAKVTWGNNLKDPSAPGPGITERLYTNAGNFDLCQKLGDNLVFYTNCDVFKQWDRDNSNKLRKQYNFEADVKFKDNEIVDETPLDILRTFSFL